MSKGTHDIPELDAGGLRKFGLTTAILFIAIFGVVGPLIKHGTLYKDGQLTPASWPFVVAGILAAPSLLFPRAMRPFYHLWMRIGLVLGWLNTRIILGVLFFLIVMPVGIVLRTLLGRDLLKQRLDASAKTYRQGSANRPRQHMEVPF
jgi:hypothetical protein